MTGFSRHKSGHKVLKCHVTHTFPTFSVRGEIHAVLDKVNLNAENKSCANKTEIKYTQHCICMMFWEENFSLNKLTE